MPKIRTMKVGSIAARIIVLSILAISVKAQTQLTQEDIWTNGNFTPRKIDKIYWFKDSESFAGLNGNKILEFSVDGDKKGKVLLDGNEQNIEISDFSFDPSEEKILVLTNKKPLWRRSYVGDYLLYDLKGGSIKALSDGGQQSYASFSPDGKKVAYVKAYNLYYKDLEKNEEIAITEGGSELGKVNGTADWLYEEEFYLTKAFEWSPEGDKIAFLSFDQEEVPEYDLQVWEGTYPGKKTIKYPKAGQTNPKVEVNIFHLATGKTINANMGQSQDIYIPMLVWTKNNDILSITRLDRAQKKLDIIHVGANSGMAQVILIDAARTFVDYNFIKELTYLDDGESFIYASEKTGFKHLFHFKINGQLIRQVTQGKYEVSELLRVDSKSGLIYYLSTEDGPAQRQVYEISLKGKKKRKLSTQAGWHKAYFSPDGKYFLDHHSSLSSAPSYSIYSVSNGRLELELEKNEAIKSRSEKYGLVTPELIQVELEDSVKLDGYVIKPSNMESGKKYPALIYVYGGPGSQKVKNQWQFKQRELWHQMMVQKGYVVYCFDNRGTGAKGVVFKKQVYRNLGKMESEDQIRVARTIAKYDFIDPERIGIWGWSYGGYLSSLCKFLDPDLFKLAVSVAPVTDWKFYNSAYTERYMEQPENNASGYESFTPLSLCSSHEGKLLLIHASGDDNVHIQNSMELVKKMVQENKKVDFMVYPEGAHSINFGDSRMNVYQKITDYLIENL